MDPPTAHIETNSVDSVTIIEGPYNVENFGTLSGLIKIFSGTINLNTGSFRYKKVGASASGGNEWFKMLYPSRTIDADYDDSNIYSLKYSIISLSDFQIGLMLSFFNSMLIIQCLHDIKMCQTPLLLASLPTT